MCYFGDVEAELIEVETRTSPFDLSLTIEATDGGLAALLQYASDLFDPRHPRAYWAVPHAAVVGRSGAEHPSERARDLRTRGPRVASLDGAAYPVEDRRVHERIEAIAARSPEALAVSDARGSLTYAELNARANQPRSPVAEGTGTRRRRVRGRSGSRRSDRRRRRDACDAGGRRRPVPIDPSFPTSASSICWVTRALVSSSLPSTITNASRARRYRIPVGRRRSRAHWSAERSRKLHRQSSSGVHRLHLRFDRAAQGSRGRAQEPGKPHCMAPRRLRTRGGRSRDAHRRGGVRRGNLGALAGARRRR